MQRDFRVGDWIVHPTINALEREEQILHLEPKVMQVLLTLAEEPGEVITRERIRSAVWPDVFVGEDVLVRAISELRRAFEDDPRSPHTIQTVPKVGYRLIASINLPEKELPAASETLPQSLVVAPQSTDLELIARVGPVGKTAWRWVSWAIAIVLIGAALVVALWRRRPVQQATAKAGYTSRPLTTYPGSQLQAAFSPEGSDVAFVWRKPGEQNGHIYIKSVAPAKFATSEAPVRLTDDDADETSPAWSPNGRYLAFIRHEPGRATVAVIAAIGGSPQDVYVLPSDNFWEYGGVAWTADGNALIFPLMQTAQSPSQLVEMNLHDHSLRHITDPPAGWDGDWTPTISPDGMKLAFVRGPDRSSRNIYVMALPNGEPKQLTHDGRLIVGLAWTGDGSSIVFASNRGGNLSLWRVSALGGTPEHEAAGGDDAYAPTIARQGNRMAYSHGTARWSILSVPLGSHSENDAEEILTSSEQDASPHLSPDGTSIAFQSWRSGAQEIWTANSDGSNPVQLTSMGAAAGSPSWSPNKGMIAFDVRPDGFAHIFVIDASGGTPRQITRGNVNDIAPSWTADGKWLLFGSTRSGSWQIWKVAADGSDAPQQVTTGGGMVAIATPDEQSIFYTKFDEEGIWQKSLSGGVERRVSDGPPTNEPAYWTLADGKLYTLHEAVGHGSILQISPRTGHEETVYLLKHAPTPFAGLAVTPDGKRLLLAELTEASSGLTLVENF